MKMASTDSLNRMGTLTPKTDTPIPLQDTSKMTPPAHVALRVPLADEDSLSSADDVVRSDLSRDRADSKASSTAHAPNGSGLLQLKVPPTTSTPRNASSFDVIEAAKALKYSYEAIHGKSRSHDILSGLRRNVSRSPLSSPRCMRSPRVGQIPRRPKSRSFSSVDECMLRDYSREDKDGRTSQTSLQTGVPSGTPNFLKVPRRNKSLRENGEL